MKLVLFWAALAGTLTSLAPRVGAEVQKKVEAASNPTTLAAPAAESEWTQWRGPGRSNIASDRGLLDQWPADGPPLLWSAKNLGEGVTSVAVARGRAYVLGYRSGAEYLSALDAASGDKLWDARIGPAVAEMRSMRWLSQRTPMVDGERIYVVTARGELICLGADDGIERWHKDYTTDFEGKRGPWGYCDYPLADGERLICTPGGHTSGIVALDKSSGELLWKCALPDFKTSTYSAVIVAEIAGVRQYVQQFSEGAVGIDTAGKILWVSKLVPARSTNVHTAVVKDDLVFLAAGWGRDAALVKLNRSGDQFEVVEQCRSRGGMYGSWFGNSSLIGEHLYNNSGYCIELRTGAMVWSVKIPLHSTVVLADGHIYYRLGDGTMILAQATPEKYVEKARFLPPRASKEWAWTSPVIAGGRLYLRDQDELLCYDLRKERSRPFQPATRPALAAAAGRVAARLKRPLAPPENDAIFVTTPQDVVLRMLEVAQVKKDDVVYDLGCGDGRIVVAAASKYGCKAVGYDIDPDCVRMSKENVREHKVANLVEIVQKDIFTLDVSGATVVTLYMGREVNLRLVPQLQKLRAGSRIVSHNFDVEGYPPEKTVEMISTEDDARHMIYMWTVPLKKAPVR